MYSCFSSQLQSGPNVPFGQHTLMVSTQNHLWRSGCFVFLHWNRKQHRKTQVYHTLRSETIVYAQITCHPGKHRKHLHWQIHTSWTTKFRKGPRAPPACGCTRSCCCRTGPPRSPSDGSRCGRKNMMQGHFNGSVAWKVGSELHVWGVTSGKPPRSGELTIAPAKCCSSTV